MQTRAYQRPRDAAPRATARTDSPSRRPGTRCSRHRPPAVRASAALREPTPAAFVGACSYAAARARAGRATRRPPAWHGAQSGTSGAGARRQVCGATAQRRAAQRERAVSRARRRAPCSRASGSHGSPARALHARHVAALPQAACGAPTAAHAAAAPPPPPPPQRSTRRERHQVHSRRRLARHHLLCARARRRRCRQRRQRQRDARGAPHRGRKGRNAQIKGVQGVRTPHSLRSTL